MTLDTITLTGVRAEGTHGVLDFEHTQPQPFVVDVRMSVDTTAAAASDDLTKTVDYGQIANRIVAVIEGEHVDLIETLAQRIADKILLTWQVRRVEVTVHKPDAPIQVPFTDVAVTITRSRESDGWPAADELARADGHVAAAADGGAGAGMLGGAAAAGAGVAQARPRTRHAVIAMGGNIGDVVQAMRAAVIALDGMPGNQVTGISPLYRTLPWGMKPGTPDFLNAVVTLTTTIEPAALLDQLHVIEAAHGRSREVHWASRPLDLDIIDIDGIVSEDPDLTLPHPRAWQRAFVLAPLADLDPGFTLAGPHGGPVARLLEDAPDRRAVTRVSDTWILGDTGAVAGLDSGPRPDGDGFGGPGGAPEGDGGAGDGGLPDDIGPVPGLGGSGSHGGAGSRR